MWPDLNSLDIDSRATSWSKVNYLYTLHFIGLIATSFLFALVIIIVKSLLKGLRIEMSLILALLLALYLLYLVAYHTHFEDFRKGYQAVISVTAWAMLSKTKQDYHIFRISCRKIAHVLAILNCFLMLI